MGWDFRARCLQLACVDRDRNISWALAGTHEFAVDRSAGRPDDDTCGRCDLLGR